MTRRALAQLALGLLFALSSLVVIPFLAWSQQPPQKTASERRATEASEAERAAKRQEIIKQAEGKAPAERPASKQSTITLPIQRMEEFFGRQEVVAELGLLDAQVEEIQNRLQKGLQQLSSIPRFTPDRKPVGLAGMQAAMVEVHLQTRKDIEQMLLPHQALRFRQLALQFNYPNQMLLIYTSDEFSKELGYTPELRSAIRDEISQSDREIREAVERAQQAARARIQARFTAEQRAKAEELVGAPFKFERETPDQIRARLRKGSGR
ncbi:MAG: hypothetical protein U0939_11015 [Pirellulales bacterium]